MRECYTGRLGTVRRADAFPQLISAPILGHNDGHHRPLGHPSGRRPRLRLPALPLALPPSARRRLPGRLCVAGGASSRTPLPKKDPTLLILPQMGPFHERRRGSTPLSLPLRERLGLWIYLVFRIGACSPRPTL